MIVYGPLPNYFSPGREQGVKLLRVPVSSGETRLFPSSTFSILSSNTSHAGPSLLHRLLLEVSIKTKSLSHLNFRRVFSRLPLPTALTALSKVYSFTRKENFVDLSRSAHITNSITPLSPKQYSIISFYFHFANFVYRIALSVL